MELSDANLITKFKQGDEKSFEYLVERYQHKIYNTTFRILGNHDDALDLAQETFIRVYNNLNTFKGKSTFSTWLFKISTNICRDELRKRQTRISTYNLSEADHQKTSYQKSNEHQDPEKISLKNELNKNIQVKIEQLPSEQKTILVLREFQDLSYAELSEVLDISMGTVKSRLSRARKALRSELYDIINEGGIK